MADTTDSGTNSYKITPTASGKWKTEAFVINDASFSKDNKTLYASLSEDFRIDAGGVGSLKMIGDAKSGSI